MTTDKTSEIRVASTLDGSAEPSLLWVPETDVRVPLVVALHTWSYDRFNQERNILHLCRDRNWALLLPEFRGPNMRTNPRAPQACGSALAKQDILDAVDHVAATQPVDVDRILLIGGSGGGHMALMMAAAAPDRWRAVSAWVPITDVAAWHRERIGTKDADNIEACCGGPPGSSSAIDDEYRNRSPMTYVDRIAKANVSVHHGRFDGRVSYLHTWRLMCELETIGAPRAFFEIFDGRHQAHNDRAFAWFETQVDAETDPRPGLTG